jgi:hypothetical protein
MDLKSLGEELIRVSNEALNSVAGADDNVLRWRPADGEWSAIEIVGHLIDKMDIWHSRVVAVVNAPVPTFDVMDQDELVIRRRYISASLEDLRRELERAATSFAFTLKEVPESVAERAGNHPEYGLLTVRRCVEIPLEGARAHIVQLQGTLSEAALPRAKGQTIGG